MDFFPEGSECRQTLVELTVFFPRTEVIIQNMDDELRRGSVINWNNFRLILSDLYKHSFPDHNTRFTPARSEFVEFIFNVLKIFDTYKCSNLSVIADVLELMCSINIDSDLAMHNRALQMGDPFYNNDGQRSITTFEKILVSSYKDIPSLFIPHLVESELRYIDFTTLNWVEAFTYYGQVHLLKAIIRFGATPTVFQDVLLERENVFVTMKTLFDFPEMPEKENSYKNHILQNLQNEFNEGSRKRLFFVITVLRILLEDTFSVEPDDYTQSIRIFVESSPEAFITSEEIKNSITRLCNKILFEESVLLQFLKLYESYFPESREDSTPRSLKHLSRFQVRENLRSARSFPYGVESLCVPKKIQDYICYKDILL